MAHLFFLREKILQPSSPVIKWFQMIADLPPILQTQYGGSPLPRSEHCSLCCGAQRHRLPNDTFLLPEAEIFLGKMGQEISFCPKYSNCDEYASYVKQADRSWILSIAGTQSKGEGISAIQCKRGPRAIRSMALSGHTS
jgi:hypothetical protein